MPVDTQQADRTGVWTGSAPPLARGFIARPESGPALAMALVPGATVALMAERPGIVGADASRGWLDACGKTQLALSQATSLWERGEVGLVVWVTATSRASLLSGYAEAAAAAGTLLTGDAELVATQFLGWLHDSTEPWLVVLDDLTAATALDERLLPAGAAGRVLITTADAAALPGPRTRIIPLGPFSRREALTYLVGRLTTDLDQRQGAIDLIGELGGEPLALAQASAVIASSELSCHDYREHFVRSRDQPGGPGAVSSGQPTGGITWSLSVDHADLLSPGTAQSMLVLTALLDGDAIPRQVLMTMAVRAYAAAGGTVHAAADGLAALDHAGLLTVDTATETATAMVRMNWLVRAAVRAAMPDGMLKGAAVAAADALLEAWPADDSPDWLARSLRSCAESLRPVAGDLLWEGACHPLLLRVGRSLDAARLTGPAVTYWEELAANGERVLGEAHPEMFAINELLAQAYLAAGRAPHAVALLQRVRADRARRYGPAHPGVAEADRSLGLALVSAGRFSDAVVVLGEAVEGRSWSQGADSPATLTARDDLAAAYRAAGAYADAIAIFRRTLTEREHNQGPRHADTTATRQKLAEAYLADGQFKAAIPLYKRVISDRERILGPGHLHTIAARGALGAAYHSAGKMAAAVRLDEQARTEYTRLLGPDHPDTLAACLNLAYAYSAVGRGSDATRLLADTVERCDATLAVADPLRVTARASLLNLSGGTSTGGQQ
jgi:tetratricopeptide (TPR) repeat protein